MIRFALPGLSLALAACSLDYAALQGQPADDGPRKIDPSTDVATTGRDTRSDAAEEHDGGSAVTGFADDGGSTGGDVPVGPSVVLDASSLSMEAAASLAERDTGQAGADEPRGERTPGDADAPSARDLVLYWKLDEPGGTVAIDSAGGQLDGAYVGATGAPTPSPDVPVVDFVDRLSRAFSRTDHQAVQLAGVPPALRLPNNLTVMVWYHTTTLDPQGMGAELVSIGGRYGLRLVEGGIRFYMHTGAAARNTDCFVSSALDGSYHHVAGVSGPEGVKVYFDGIERCSGPVTDAIAYDGAHDVLVGRRDGDGLSEDFDGNIDDVRVYGRALPADEVLQLSRGH